MGIQNLKEMIGFILSVTEVAKSIADNQSTGLGAVLKFLPVLPRLIPALRDVNMIIPELKDLSEEERAELKLFIAQDFDLVDDEVEAAIENALYVLVDLSQLVQLFK